MALSADQIRVIQDYVNSAMASNPNNWVDVVTQKMDEVGVSPAMLQEAYPQLSVADIQRAYTQSRPTGLFAAAPTPAPITPAPITPTPVSVPSAPVPGTGYTAPVVDPLTAASGESMIDPVIAPYLSEALGRARSLFLTGAQPELYPGQMYVSPSEATLSALSGMEQLAGAAQPFYEQAAGGVTTGLTGLQRTAAGEFLGGATFKNAAGEDVNYRTAMIEAATRPLTQQFTEQVIPGIQSTFSQARRLGSGAQEAVTGRATEGFGRAIGDVATNIAAQDYARERAFQEAATRDVLKGAAGLGDVFTSFLAPSRAMAEVGAQREAIAGQPLAESIRRFEYGQNLPREQFANYMAAIYGSPLGGATAATEMPGSSTLQNLGSIANIAGSLGRFGETNLGSKTFNFLGSMFA